MRDPRYESSVRHAIPSRARNLSPNAKLLARAVYYLPREVADRVTGRRDATVPPRWLWFVGGGGDFIGAGRRLARQIIEVTELRPDEAVLEIGCGVGRIAGPLTGHIEASGSYDGFDIVARAISWCQGNITPRFPNFRFTHADVYNKKYNPGGSADPARYAFPYEDATFDAVYATSVLTHMLRPEVERYIDETVRVLRPGGRAFLTFFLLDDETRERMSSGVSTIDFRVPLDGAMTVHADTPETAVAYDESAIRRLLADAGAHVREPVLYGSWSGRPNPLTYQDVILVDKPST